MSHMYRYTFIEQLLAAKAEILFEITHLLQNYEKSFLAGQTAGAARRRISEDIIGI